MSPAGRLPADRRRGVTHSAAPADTAGLPSCPDRGACRRSPDARASAWPDMDTVRCRSHAPDECRNRRSRFLPERMSAAPDGGETERSWHGLPDSSLLQPAIRRVRVIYHDLAHEIGRQSFRQYLLPIELPVRIIR